ncbi:MAG: ribbon-helix-helix protein, CopG family [Gemmatimonadaceae bacterium]
MAIPKIKATYSLDPETVRLLERVSRRWGVSKSEALRRAIRASAGEDSGVKERLAAFERFQSAMSLTKQDAEKWIAEVRAERRAQRRPRNK